MMVKLVNKKKEKNELRKTNYQKAKRIKCMLNKY
jgi:hypothetical protein